MTRPSASAALNISGGSRSAAADAGSRRTARGTDSIGIPASRRMLDVAACRAVGDPEPLAELVGADAGAGLDQLEREQRPCGGVGVVHPGRIARIADAIRPELVLRWST